MANRELPWFKFEPRAWLTDIDVRSMSLECRGAYIELLSYQWENGGIPSDAATVASVLGLQSMDDGVRFQATIWAAISARFPIDQTDGMRKNPRLAKERKKQRRVSANLSNGGKKGRQKQLACKELTGPARACPGPTPGILDGDGDGDEDEEKNKSSQQKPVDDIPPWTSKQGIQERWNALASGYDLRSIRGLNQTRLSRARARIKDDPEFWTQLEAALGRRSEWAREHRFPTFDQATTASTYQKLIEGNYDREPGAEEECQPISREDRRRFIREQRAAGETF